MYRRYINQVSLCNVTTAKKNLRNIWVTKVSNIFDLKHFQGTSAKRGDFFYINTFCSGTTAQTDPNKAEWQPTMNECLAETKVYDNRNQTIPISRLSGNTMHSTEAAWVQLFWYLRNCTAQCHLSFLPTFLNWWSVLTSSTVALVKDSWERYISAVVMPH